MAIIVQKYGGTSVGTIDRIKMITSRIIEQIKLGNQVVIVVSAMGKTTDYLVDYAKQITAKPNKRELDMLLSTGEQVTIALLTMALLDKGYEAISLTGWQAGIKTEPFHNNARIVDIDITRLKTELNNNKIVIVAGFQGISELGEITTLGRGGSDTTAVALAAALKAERCEIYTDVTGVFTADPRAIRNARQLYSVSYDEMLELANLGAAVLHPRAVEFAKNYHVELVVKSSVENKTGTIIEEETTMENHLIVRGVAFEKHITRITVFGLPNAINSLSSIFTSLAKNQVDVDIIIQNTTDNSLNNLSFSVKTDDLEIAMDVLNKQKDLIQFDHIEWETGLAKVSIVGSGMVSNPGVAAQMFEALANENIFIKMVSTSEIKISVVVAEGEVIKAAQTLHNIYNLGKVEEKVR
ncbi:aspartate kinase [Bacillus kwashiorkori]|uniref:aspartate kinase n=1 Tax=Bacillus kwashiorkori TaxID=1522318 RepID=UPI000780CA11|nr:aspartate kinase [Bacillus kwashiorkori]